MTWFQVIYNVDNLDTIEYSPRDTIGIPLETFSPY
jgi:hypothetical protein